MNNLPAAIAWRYLKAKKSHGAVSVIATVSIVGVAVATAAIVCVLSVFNGFRSIIGNNLDLLAPDITVTPAEGKAFADADSLLNIIRSDRDVAVATLTVSDNALAVVGGAEMPVTLKGVDPAAWRRITSIDSCLLEGGRFDIASSERVVGEDEYGEPLTERRSGAVMAIGAASQLGVFEPGTRMLVFAPRRRGRVNTANPLTSFVTDSVAVTGIFRTMQSQYDENLIVTDLSTARRLLEYENGATAIEIQTKPGADYRAAAARLQERLGKKVTVNDRERLQETSFRMVEIEKWVTFLLLFFILVIASFNIISTLSMLVLEKEPSMTTLHNLGMTRRRIGAVFGWESVYVALIGGGSGIVLGVILCLIQEKFGLIKLNGDPATLVMTAYPVELQPADLLAAAAPVVIIGLLTAWIASSFAKSRLQTI